MLFGISHIFDKTIKIFQKEGYYSYSSQSGAVYNKYTMYVWSGHATVDLMLMAVYRKDRSLERIAAYIIILKPITSDTLQGLTTTLDKYVW